jgi:hypothetical protein
MRVFLPHVLARSKASQPATASERGRGKPALPCSESRRARHGVSFQGPGRCGACEWPARLLPYTTVQAVVLVRVVTLSWQKGKKARMAGVGSEEGYGRR